MQKGIGDESGEIFHVHLLKDPAFVGKNRLSVDAQLLGNLGLCHSLNHVLHDLKQRIIWGIQQEYAHSISFLGVGGRKITRDLIYVARFVFLENYRYYCEHNLFDYPHKEWRMCLMGAVIPLLMMRLPVFCKAYQDRLNATMRAPLEKAVEKDE